MQSSTVTAIRTAAFCLMAAALLVVGCDSVEPEVDEQEDDRDPMEVIEEHIDTFLEEAEARDRTGLLYQPSRLQILPQDTVRVEGEELCGFGGVDDEGRPEILVATNDACWDRSTWDREILVFHELGHALLGRGHTDRTLPNGLRGSIMTGGHLFGLYSESRLDWRTYYVDEMFDQDAPDPDWSTQP